MTAICFIAHIARLLILRKIYPVFNLFDYLSKNILPAIVTFTITYGCILYFNHQINNLTLRLFIACIASPILTILIAFFINTSHEEKRLIYHYIIKGK